MSHGASRNLPMIGAHIDPAGAPLPNLSVMRARELTTTVPWYWGAVKPASSTSRAIWLGWRERRVGQTSTGSGEKGFVLPRAKG